MSSLITALIISQGKRWLVRILGEISSCETQTQVRISSCTNERKFRFLLQVLLAGTFSSSGTVVTLVGATASTGVCWDGLARCGDFWGSVTGGACVIGGSTLGADTLGATFGGNTGGQNNKFRAASFRGVQRPHPNLFCGRLTRTFHALLGGVIGRFTVGLGGGRRHAAIRLSLVNLVSRCGYCCTICSK